MVEVVRVRVVRVGVVLEPFLGPLKYYLDMKARTSEAVNVITYTYHTYTLYLYIYNNML